MWLVASGSLSAQLADAAPADLRLNEVQFVGTHNSYKQALSWWARWLLRWQSPEALAGLEYAHRPIVEQLNAGARKLELDVFYEPESGGFIVGHAQLIDMNSHCAQLSECLQQILQWSQAHPKHLPVWIGVNAKDAKIDGLPDPAEFSAAAWRALDQSFLSQLGGRLIRPEARAQWPLLSDSTGRFLLILDEGVAKSAAYRVANPEPAMFVKAYEGVDRFSSVAVLNDPLQDKSDIEAAVRAGYLVRTRADADTKEARAEDGSRRRAAFVSGAQAVSTDYLWPSEFFESNYRVELPDVPKGAVARCNELLRAPCAIFEE